MIRSRSVGYRIVVAAVVSSLALLSAGGDAPAATAVPAVLAASETLDGEARGIRPEEGQVERLYQAVFGRAPDRSGFDYWLTLRTSGVSLALIADQFMLSDEFRLRFGARDDAGLVHQLYHNVLDREPDPAGRSYWLEQLDAGLARRDIVLLFSESSENRQRTETESPVLGSPEMPTFAAASRPASADELGATWRPGCPVPPEDLVILTVRYMTFDGGVSTGDLVVHRLAAPTVTEVFQLAYERRFPIESIRPASDFDGDDDAIMAANATSGFNCRAITGGTTWSRHAFGTAVDINPRQNPYVRGSVVLPPEGGAYVDRSVYHPGMLRDGGPIVALVRARGWRWGGDWISLKDYQHIDARLSDL